MPVVGSTVTIDIHITGETDVDSLRGAVRRDNRPRSKLENQIREAIEQNTRRVLDEEDIEDYDLSTSIELVDDRVPGAPRERITASLDLEGEGSVVAAIDEALATPQRAQIADAVESSTRSLLGENDLLHGVDVTVSVTPIQFR